MGNLRIVHVDDSENILKLMKEVLEWGFKSEKGTVELRQDKNFDRVEEDIKNGNLADVYILDNEITERRDLEGAEIAQRIHGRAGKPVVIISLLSSNPDGVVKKYGKELNFRSIPTLSKVTEAHLCFFYVGDCLRRLADEERKLTFEEWLEEQRIERKKESELGAEETLSLKAIQDRMLAYVSMGGEGAFWVSLDKFLKEHKAKKLI